MLNVKLSVIFFLTGHSSKATAAGSTKKSQVQKRLAKGHVTCRQAYHYSAIRHHPRALFSTPEVASFQIGFPRPIWMFHDMKGILSVKPIGVFCCSETFFFFSNAIEKRPFVNVKSKFPAKENFKL